MSHELQAGFDLSQLRERTPVPELEPDELRARYIHMAVEPEAFAQMEWIDTVLAHQPNSPPSASIGFASFDNESGVPEDVFRTYVGYVATSSAGLFGVKKDLVRSLLASSVGVQRFRTAVVQACAMHFPGPYGALESFTHKHASYWNAWHLPFIHGVVPKATTEELQHMHVQQRIHLPSDVPSGLILPS